MLRSLIENLFILYDCFPTEDIGGP